MMIRPDNSDRLYGPLREWILAFAGVTEAPHRFGGTEFRVKGVEFMHSHGPRFLDIRLSMEDQGRVLREGKALRHRFASQAGWVSLRVLSEDDVGRAKELIGLAYDRATKAVESHERRRSDTFEKTQV